MIELNGNWFGVFLTTRGGMPQGNAYVTDGNPLDLIPRHEPRGYRAADDIAPRPVWHS